jgi:glycosyltransferase involved in cell wall biosynthesis
MERAALSERSAGAVTRQKAYLLGETPLVSVVIGFLNEERFLAEAVESVRAQTYPHWELLLCDDGSADGSAEIARRYAAADPQRVRYLAHPGHVNRGKSAVRNLGIRHARGELVAFLDADDVWLPHKLARQVALLRANPTAAMLYGRTLFWWSWSADPAAPPDCLTEEGLAHDRLVPPPIPLVRYLEDQTIYPCICSVIVRREVLDDVGSFEENYREGSQDMVLHAKIFLRYPVYVSSECWDRYRRHENSFWARMKRDGLYQEEGRPHPTQHRYLVWLDGYLAAEGIDSPEVTRALRKALWPYEHPRLYDLEQRLAPPLRELRHRASHALRRLTRSR